MSEEDDTPKGPAHPNYDVVSAEVGARLAADCPVVPVPPPQRYCATTATLVPPILFRGRWAMFTSSFVRTNSAILLSFSWFLEFTAPKLLIRSPTFKPASSAGLWGITVLTLAKGT